jgi:hypothetical protein
MTFDVLVMVSIEAMVLWDVIPYNLVDSSQHFQAKCYPFLGWRRWDAT